MPVANEMLLGLHSANSHKISSQLTVSNADTHIAISLKTKLCATLQRLHVQIASSKLYEGGLKICGLTQRSHWYDQMTIMYITCDLLDDIL